MRPRNTLLENAVEELRQMILTGQIRPGEFLPPQKELAARLGVGLSTIREAVRTLAAVGLVESYPGKGTWVCHDAVGDLIHPTAVKTRLGDVNAQMAYEARSVIEVALTEFAARRALPADIERIQGALQAMREHVDDEEAFVAADLAFHVAVARAGHNELLEELYHLANKLIADFITELVRLPNVKDESIVIQSAIAQAIAKRDPHKARLAGLDHMRYIGRLLDLSEPADRS